MMEVLVPVVHFTRDSELYVSLYIVSIFVSGFGRFVFPQRQLLIFIIGGRSHSS